MIARILGNLAAEEELAATFAPQGPRAPRPLSRSALEISAGAATLLRAFARDVRDGGDADRLWTPAPVAPERLAAAPGLPIPELESGPLAKLPPAGAVLAWAETASAAAQRAAAPQTLPSLAQEGGESLHDLLWRLPPPSPAAVAAAHHRGFCLDVATELGLALPGARRVDSMEALESALRSGEFRGWVVKAPFSAAGRSRYLGWSEREIAEPSARRAVASLFERHGTLLLEPWMDRTEDFGCTALLLPEEVRLVSFHRQLVDRRGQFLGIELSAQSSGFEGLAAAELAEMERALDGVASALRKVGYSGPFGIDAWRYRTPDGAVAFHPLGEINARMTFGLVARALADRLREALGLAPQEKVRLKLGRQIPAADAVIPLLLPGGPGTVSSGAAWIEIAGRAR